MLWGDRNLMSRFCYVKTKRVLEKILLPIRCSSLLPTVSTLLLFVFPLWGKKPCNLHVNFYQSWKLVTLRSRYFWLYNWIAPLALFQIRQELTTNQLILGFSGTSSGKILSTGYFIIDKCDSDMSSHRSIA